MRLLAITGALTLALDQATKYIVVVGLDLLRQGEILVWPPFLTFRMAWNRGVNFGLFSNTADAMRWILVAIALAICGWVLWWVRRTGGGRRVEVAAGLLVGGALGNVIDRLVWGAVADFLNMSCCGIDNPYAFNVADAAIFAGAVGLALFAGKASPSAPDRKRKTS